MHKYPKKRFIYKKKHETGQKYQEVTKNSLKMCKIATTKKCVTLPKQRKLACILPEVQKKLCDRWL